jgi:hypothetical protein
VLKIQAQQDRVGSPDPLLIMTRIAGPSATACLLPLSLPGAECSMDASRVTAVIFLQRPVMGTSGRAPPDGHKTLLLLPFPLSAHLLVV